MFNVCCTQCERDCKRHDTPRPGVKPRYSRIKLPPSSHDIVRKIDAERDGNHSTAPTRTESHVDALKSITAKASTPKASQTRILDTFGCPWCQNGHPLALRATIRNKRVKEIYFRSAPNDVQHTLSACMSATTCTHLRWPVFAKHGSLKE